MKGKIIRGNVRFLSAPISMLLLLAACFLFGVFGGHSAAYLGRIETDEALRPCIELFLKLLQDRKLVPASWTVSLLAYFTCPLLALLLGRTAAGVWAIPVLAFFQGFSLSFSVSAFMSAAEEHALLLALALFGLRCLIVLPCFFYLGANAMLCSAGKRQGRRADHSFPEKPYSSGRTAFELFVCAALLLLGACLEHTCLVEFLYALLL